MPEPDVPTIHEAAALLCVKLKAAYTLAQNSELPGFKVGGQVRFRGTDIEARNDKQTRLAQKVGER